jgi:hypothetical protein
MATPACANRAGDRQAGRHGFVEISTANGQDAIAKVTGWAHLNASGLFGYDGIVSVNFDCNDWLFVRLRRVG